MIGANRDILKFVRKARDRMHMALMLEYTVKVLTLALGIYLALTVLSRFVPIYNAYGKGALLTGALTMTGFLTSLFMTPKDKSAAMLLDSKGLNERTMTALELLNDSSPIAMLQREDALRCLRALNIKKEIKMKYPTKLSLISCLLVILIVVSGFMPNPMEERAVELHKIKEEITRQQKEIDKVVKKVENNNKLSMEQKKEADAALKELKKELSKARDLKEAEKSIHRTESKINMMKQKYTDTDLDKIISTFSKNQATKNLAEVLKRGDTDKLRKDLNNTAKALKSLNQEQIKELSKNLSELAKNLGQNPELASAFNELSQKMADGELGDMQAAMSELEEQLESLMQNDEFSKAMDEAVNELKSGGL